jgi:nitrilase
MTTVRAAAVQLRPVLYSRDGTVERVVAKIDELATRGVQFATFPETIVPYYPYFSWVQRPYEMIAEQTRLMGQAVTVPSSATHAIADAASRAEMVVSIGVNERDGGSLFNTQLLFDADGTLIQRRRKITSTYHERMIWGQGDGSGLRAVDSAVGRIGQLACWEHYNPLARYALMADGEKIHPPTTGWACFIQRWMPSWRPELDQLQHCAIRQMPRTASVSPGRGAGVDRTVARARSASPIVRERRLPRRLGRRRSER